MIQSERDTVIKGMGMNIPNREEVRGWDVEQVQEYLKQVRQTESFVNSSAKFNLSKSSFLDVVNIRDPSMYNITKCT